MSPKGLSNLDILDQIQHIGLVLDLLSFSGGENLIGSDQELEANEARVIKNWDANALGGMIRSKGFTLAASAPKAIEADVFTGSGLNDLTQGGTYVGAASAVFTIILDATGTPDTFKWKKDSGSFTTGVAITGAAQTLSEGVTVTFAATTGHTLSDQWTIQTMVYVTALDLMAHHFEGNNTEVYTVCSGDLLLKSSSSLIQEDINAFTANILCHAVSAANALWITNSTDNLKRKTIGGALAAPAGLPANARERIYEHNFRLIAEGGGKEIYGSRVGSGNWTNANAWSASNDAWSMTMPDNTRGAVMGFPSGNDITIFTEFDTYVIYNQPNVARRRIGNGKGCGAPYSIARGDAGVFFLSTFPTLGIWLWDSVNYINLTEKHNFIDNVNLSGRIFGIYKDQKYIFIYNESGSGVTYPNRIKIYDTRFGRWMERPVNLSVADNFGYPVLLTRDNNELYLGSSLLPKIYDFEDASTSDNGFNTEADYTTKNFTSKDFKVESGGQFSIDGVRMKLVKASVTHNGIGGTFSLAWSANRGAYFGSKTFSLSTTGDLINKTFIINTSFILGASPTKMTTKSFNNSAVGREFNFQILNSNTGERPEIKKIRIHALALEEA